MTKSQNSALVNNVFHFVKKFGINMDVSALRKVRVSCLSCESNAQVKDPSIAAVDAHVHILDARDIFANPEFARTNRLPFLCPKCAKGFTDLLRQNREYEKAGQFEFVVKGIEGSVWKFHSEGTRFRGVLQRLQEIEEVRQAILPLVGDVSCRISGTALAESKLGNLELAISHESGDKWLKNAGENPHTDELYRLFDKLMSEKKALKVGWDRISECESYEAWAETQRAFSSVLTGKPESEIETKYVNPPKIFNFEEPTAIRVGRDEYVLLSGIYAVVFTQEAYLAWSAKAAEKEDQFGDSFNNPYPDYVTYCKKSVYGLMRQRSWLRRHAAAARDEQKSILEAVKSNANAFVPTQAEVDHNRGGRGGRKPPKAQRRFNPAALTTGN